MKAWLTAAMALESAKKAAQRIGKDIESGIRVARQLYVDEQAAAEEKKIKLATMRAQVEGGVRGAEGMRVELLRMASALSGMPPDARIELDAAECYLLGDTDGMTK